MKICKRFTRCSPLFSFVCGFLLGVYLVSRLSLIVLKRHGNLCLKPPPVQRVGVFSHHVNSKQNLNTDEQFFVLVAVMTTRENLETRAAAINLTWAPSVPGRVLFFVGKGGNYTGNLSVVVLDDVSDDVYPPQKKSFSMLKYMHDNYLHQFEWFMRADDDLFVNSKDLEVFLRSVNSSRRLYVGHPGLGVPNERGHLGLRSGRSFYCLGGPGVLFTRETLRLTVSGLSTCLNNTVTSHEDTELGRCVHEQVRVSCTCAHEFQRLFYQNYRAKNGSFQGKLEDKLTHALTLHPVKKPPYLYRLHNFFNSKEIVQLKRKLSHLEETVSNINNYLSQQNVNQKYSKINNEYNNEYRGTDIWNFIRQKFVYSTKDPFQKPFQRLRTRGRHLGFSVSRHSLNRLRMKSFKFLFAYENVSTRSGLKHILTVENVMSLKSFLTVQPFQPIEIKEIVAEYSNNDVIYMILPLYKRSKTFVRFLKSLSIAVSNKHFLVYLIVVIYKDNLNEYMFTLNYINEVNYTNINLKLQVIQMTEDFSRAKAMKKGLENLSPNSLVVVMDVDMRLTGEFLHRVFLNTKLGKQVYFPIYFSQYDPNTICFSHPDCFDNKTSFHFNQDYGTWRHFSYGIVGVYKSDVTDVGGFNTLIEGWGKEDTDFFEKCLKHDVAVFRSVDPGLLHVHHDRVCDVRLPRDQFKMCTQSREALFGSQSVLSDIVFNMTGV